MQMLGLVQFAELRIRIGRVVSIPTVAELREFELIPNRLEKPAGIGR